MSDKQSIIRVLVCDDSAVWRRIVDQVLKTDPRMQVVCETSNGEEALQKIRIHRPDVVILDVEMPYMDGVETVREIRNRNWTTPVIMFSTITSYGSEATLDALEAGANDYVTKPSTTGAVKKALEEVGHALTSKIVAVLDHGRSKSILSSPIDAQAKHSIRKPNLNSRKIGVIGIGASTGGPLALSKVISDLPAKLTTPILITQHMPSSFIASLANRLSALSNHEVKVATHAEQLQPGMIRIAPGNRHLCLRKKSNKLFTVLDDGPPVNSCRPAVDKMFESIANHFDENCLGVVLTGMGKDGLNGSRSIKKRGGIIFAQDAISSVVFGMPREVIEAGLADRILPIDNVAAALSEAFLTSKWISHRKSAAV